MRKLMWFTIGFASAMFICIELLELTGLLYLLPVCAVLIILFAVFRKRIRIWALLVAVFIGFFAGTLWTSVFHSIHLESARSFDGETIFLNIEATDYSYATQYGSAGEGIIKLNNDDAYDVKFYINEEASFSPGDTIEGKFRLQLTTSDSKEGETYHQGNGMFLLAYAADETTIQNVDKAPAKYFPAVMRQWIVTKLDAVFPNDAEGFARALLLGDTSKLSYAEDTAFKVSGIRHVVAVSGLHISILFSMVYILVGKRNWLTAIFGLPVLLLFAAIAGFTPSVVRACIMQALMIVGMLLNREYDPPTALAFSVLTMLAVNPFAITSVSLQLSVSCMIGIFLFSQRIHDYLLSDQRMGSAKGDGIKPRLKRWFVGSVSISLGTTVVTVPLCAYYFGTVSLIGILSNLILLWAVSIIFYGVMISCILGAIWIPLGKAVAWIISWMIRFVLVTSNALSRVPFSSVYLCSDYILIWLIFGYILLAVFLFYKAKRPFLFGFYLTAVLMLSITASYLEPKYDDFRVTVLDVGQGQSILLQNKGKSYLVDCGGDSGRIAADKASQMLRSQGKLHLDGLILTHYDEDHIGGVDMLLSVIDVDKIYVTLPDPETESDELLAEKYADRIFTVTEDIKLELETAILSIFAAEPGTTGNESSLCVLFQTLDCDILITGDRNYTGEKQLLEKIDLPDIEILVAGHHGSKNSTSMSLLNAVRPDLAVISVSEENSFGHPDPLVLKRLEVFNCKILRTDQEGTIVLRR